MVKCASVSKLGNLSAEALDDMISGTDIMCQDASLHDGLLMKSGESFRYSAMALLGLKKAGKLEKRHMPIFSRLSKEVSTLSNAGDIGLYIWLASELKEKIEPRVMERFVSLAKSCTATMELSWCLIAMTRLWKANATDADDAKNIFEKIKNNFNAETSLFHYSAEKGRLSTFNNQVYPIHALSEYNILSSDENALDIASRCAEKICALQGTDGQWWWIYDVDKGVVSDGYPVYAVHQDGMAPMALFALRNAGGPNFSANVKRGLLWLHKPPEVSGELVDEKEKIIWRSVRRKSFLRKICSGLARLGMRPFNRMGLFEINHETRPYHYGWILYAAGTERV